MAVKKTTTTKIPEKKELITPPEYISKLITKTIKATSRMSIKIKDNFYTFEFMEERMVPEDLTGINLDKEKEMLWEMVHGQVDEQVEEVLNLNKLK